MITGAKEPSKDDERRCFTAFRRRIKRFKRLNLTSDTYRSSSPAYISRPGPRSPFEQLLKNYKKSKGLWKGDELHLPLEHLSYLRTLTSFCFESLGKGCSESPQLVRAPPSSPPGFFKEERIGFIASINIF